jgi:glycosyltransferase involved in cell wall biosynthesis
MSLRYRVRRKLRVGLGRVAVRLPADRGPAVCRNVLGRARIFEARRLVRGVRGVRDYAAAERAIQPLLDNASLSSRAWSLRAEVLRAQGDSAGALVAARRSTAAHPVEFDAVELHSRLAALSGHSGEASEVLEWFLAVEPRNQKQVDVAVEALVRQGSLELLGRYRTALHGWGKRQYDQQLDRAVAEVRLVAAHAAGSEAYEAELNRVLDVHTQPTMIVLHALTRRRAWEDLALYLDTRLPDSIDDLGQDSSQDIEAERAARALASGRAASKALKAGRVAAADSLARRILARRPDNAAAIEAHDEASDQLAVVANGWPSASDGSSTPYEPRPDAVLSVLAQSLPITSGGYATRSHGILTGLSTMGWDMRAATRLGFPYDWWRGLGEHDVRPLDVVDGISYHRLYDEGVREYPQHPLATYIARYAERLTRHAVEHRACLIHAASFYVNGLAAGAAARELGLPFLYEMRGLEDLMKVSRDASFASSERYRFLTTVENAACREADVVFVITDALRREMIDRGVPEERLVVLPNGVDVDRFRPRDRDTVLADELGVTGKTVIGYAGGLVDYEGLDLLLEASAALKEHRDDFLVVVVGDGQFEQILRDMAARLRLDDVVTFTGRVPHSEVDRYISLFDITPFPRLPLPVCELISPIKPFESMAMGKAVVSSSVAALTEIVDDGHTGLVFDKGSAADLARVLGQLLDSPERRAALGHAARKWVVAERDWSHTVSIVDATYRRVLDGRAGTSASQRTLRLS